MWLLSALLPINTGLQYRYNIQVNLNLLFDLLFHESSQRIYRLIILNYLCLRIIHLIKRSVVRPCSILVINSVRFGGQIDNTATSDAKLRVWIVYRTNENFLYGWRQNFINHWVYSTKLLSSIIWLIFPRFISIYEKIKLIFRTLLILFNIYIILFFWSNKIMPFQIF